MMYLLPSDYAAALADKDLTTLDALNPDTALPAEKLALAEVRRELQGFDLTAALAPVLDHDPALAYPAGTRAYNEAFGLHEALQSVPADTELDNTAYWAVRDTRPPELLEAILRLTFYHLAARLTVDEMPPFIDLRARAIRDWLRQQADGTAPALLPRLAESGSVPAFGSLPPVMDGRAIW